MSAATVLAAHVLDTCDVEGSLAYRPPNLSTRLAFVAPADTWKEYDDEGGVFCAMTIGLDVYLVSGSADFVDSFDWLDEQSTLLMQAGSIDVGTDTIAATSVGAPFVFSDGSGASYLTCRVAYSRLRSE